MANKSFDNNKFFQYSFDLDELELSQSTQHQHKQESFEKKNLGSLDLDKLELSTSCLAQPYFDSFDLTFAAYSFDMDQLELSTRCLAQTFKPQSLEKPFEKELDSNLFNKSFHSNIFPQISFNEIFANNIFQKVSFSISFGNNFFENEQVAFEQLCFVSASCSTTSSSTTALTAGRLRRRMSLDKTFWNLSLRKCMPIKLVRLIFQMVILNKSFGKCSFRELSLQQNNQEQEQLSATVPDSKLLQLHLSQLCQQDPESAISRQLPEEPLSASGLRTAAWPASVQTDKPRAFQRQKLAEQDLTTISLEEFFPENFGKQLSDKQLPAQQLQNNQLQKNTFQQLSLEHPSFTEKTLQKELATTFAKNSLTDNLVSQNVFFATLAWKKVASETAWREQPLQEAACREQP